jgi:signal transduction histidine kinase
MCVPSFAQVQYHLTRSSFPLKLTEIFHSGSLMSNTFARDSLLFRTIRLASPLRRIVMEMERRNLTSVVGMCLVYYVATRVGMLLTPPSYPIATFWPPNAILTAVLLLTTARKWPWLLLGVIPAHFASQLPLGIPVLTSLGRLIGNTGEAVLAAGLVLRLVPREELFRTIRGAAVFFVCAVAIAPLLTSFFDAGVVVLTGWAGNDYWHLWVNRLLSNILAELTLVPVVVTLLSRQSWPWDRPSRRRLIEGAFLWTALLIVCGLVFWQEEIRLQNLALALYLPLPLLLWAAVRFGPGGASLSALIVAIVAITSAMTGNGPFGQGNTAEHVLSLQLFLCMFTVPLLLLATEISERRELALSLLASRGKIISAHEEERRRIARDLHDDFGQRLATLQLEVDRMRGTATQTIQNELESAGSDISSLIDDMRRLSHSLHPFTLEYAGLCPALAELSSRFKQRTGIEVKCTCDIAPRKLPIDFELCIYRVAQEALQNIRKHSGASNVEIRVSETLGLISLAVVDDGRGFSETEFSPGLGFTSMQERVYALGGRFTYSGAVGRGTLLKAILPIPERKTKGQVA